MRTAGAISLLAGTALAVCTLTGQAEADVYLLDGDHTHIVWQVDRFGFANTIGTFTEVKGTISFDDKEPDRSHVSAEIALSGLRSDLAEREDIVRGAFWLDARSHPVITFESHSVTFVDDESCASQCAVVDGDMVLKGVRRPLRLNVVVNKTGLDPVQRRQAIGFTATGSFQRSDFGIRTALGPIGDEVEFQIEALAIAAE